MLYEVQSLFRAVMKKLRLVLFDVTGSHAKHWVVQIELNVLWYFNESVVFYFSYLCFAWSSLRTTQKHYSNTEKCKLQLRNAWSPQSTYVPTHVETFNKFYIKTLLTSSSRERALYIIYIDNCLYLQKTVRSRNQDVMWTSTWEQAVHYTWNYSIVYIKYTLSLAFISCNPSSVWSVAGISPRERGENQCFFLRKN